jgi:hypothetical protein
MCFDAGLMPTVKGEHVMKRFSVICLFFAAMVWASGLYAQVSSDIRQDWRQQYHELQKAIKNKDKDQGPEDQMLDRNAMILESDRTSLDIVIRRGQALLAYMKTLKDAPDLSKEAKLLAKLADKNAAAALEGESAIKLFMTVKEIVRSAMLANPLLDFDSILFVERKCIGPGNYVGGHMTTASLGHTQLYGGGLYVVSGIKTDKPVVRNLLENSVIEKGAGKGEKLTGGAFISPELSFDGKEILFGYAKPAYTSTKRKWEYTEDNSFHIFKVNRDGTSLLQITRGNYNDFDPCYLPDGRIAFISTRMGKRGKGWIYSRCFKDGSPAQFFLNSMKADGSDIVTLSFHETDEWQPSVNNDGMIVYTRWDYVDRNANAAQHIWTCFPDGRDPRAPHGNYVHPYSTMEGSDFGPGIFTTRPDCEWHIRAIAKSASYTGSSRYIATAGPHHGEPFGALVLIDTSIEDDGLMSQVKRITPNKFPESEVNSEKSWEYGTPWPLSEDFYIANCRAGICLLDRFGNRELICKTQNSLLRAIEPIPLKARPKPPVIPVATWQGENASAMAPKATVAVMNAYVSDLPYPEGTELKELRIIQYFPKSTGGLFEPVIGYAEQSLARMVLGTVPIEKDGSAYFQAPVGKAISFQLIDQNGIAVQGMRSITYVHPGEQLACLGCHESKQHAPPRNTTTPLAMRRKPSKITPEVGSLEPLNFHRLVKPVLEKKCVGCHKEKNKAPDMSYKSLQDYAFYLVGGKPTSGRWLTIPKHGGSRSVPGKHGAYGAPLLKYLDATHYDVELTKEQRRRITMWLDCNSNELGAYKNEDAQRKGKLVWPVFDLDQNNPMGVE